MMQTEKSHKVPGKAIGKRIEDYELQDLVERFIRKDSILEVGEIKVRPKEAIKI